MKDIQLTERRNGAGAIVERYLSVTDSETGVEAKPAFGEMVYLHENGAEECYGRELTIGEIVTLAGYKWIVVNLSPFMGYNLTLASMRGRLTYWIFHYKRFLRRTNSNLKYTCAIWGLCKIKSQMYEKSWKDLDWFWRKK